MSHTLIISYKTWIFKKLSALSRELWKKLLRSESSPLSVILEVHLVQLENNLKKTFFKKINLLFTILLRPFRKTCSLTQNVSNISSITGVEGISSSSFITSLKSVKVFANLKTVMPFYLTFIVECLK